MVNSMFRWAVHCTQYVNINCILYTVHCTEYDYLGCTFICTYVSPLPSVPTVTRPKSAISMESADKVMLLHIGAPFHL